MTAQLSRGQLKARCKSEIEQLEITLKNGSSDTPNLVEEELEIYRLALAAMDSEPVAYADPKAFSNFQAGTATKEWMWCKPDTGLLPLYAVPPAPVAVTKKSNTDYFDTLALDTAREIMCDVNRRADFLGGDIQLLSRIQCRIDDACRAAMQAEPVTAATTKIEKALKDILKFYPENMTSSRGEMWGFKQEVVDAVIHARNLLAAAPAAPEREV